MSGVWMTIIVAHSSSGRSQKLMEYFETHITTKMQKVSSAFSCLLRVIKKENNLVFFKVHPQLKSLSWGVGGNLCLIEKNHNSNLSKIVEITI